MKLNLLIKQFELFSSSLLDNSHNNNIYCVLKNKKNYMFSTFKDNVYSHEFNIAKIDFTIKNILKDWS
jgi:hypothetical protein